MLATGYRERNLERKIYTPRIYKDRETGAWVCEDDVRLAPRFRHPVEDRDVIYREHPTFEEACATYRQEAALAKAKAELAAVKARLYRDGMPL